MSYRTRPKLHISAETCSSDGDY